MEYSEEPDRDALGPHQVPRTSAIFASRGRYVDEDDSFLTRTNGLQRKAVRM